MAYGSIYPFPRKPEPEPEEEWGGFFPSDISEPPPAREWMVDATIPRGTVCLLTGAPKVAKSLLLQQLLTCHVLGLPWIGRHVEKAPALGFFCEDDEAELKRRQWAINEHLEIETPYLYRDLELNAREGLSTRLVNFEKFSDIPRWTPLWHQIWNIADDCGYQMFGFDTATVMFGGDNLNMPGRATVFLRELTKKVAARNASAIITAHTNRLDPRSFAGPNAWHGSVRSAMNLSRPVDPKTGRVAHERRFERQLIDLGGNYADQYQDVTLRWDKGVLVNDDDALPVRPTDAISRAEFDARVLAGMKRAIGIGIKIAADPTGKYSIPWCAKHSTDQEFKRSAINDLNDSQDRMVRGGRIIRVMVQKGCKLRPSDGAPYPGEEPWLL